MGGQSISKKKKNSSGREISILLDIFGEWLLFAKNDFTLLSLQQLTNNSFILGF